MAIEHLNGDKSQLWRNTALDYLNDISGITTDGSLEGQLRIFLLTCQVNNLSPRSIQDYAQKIGRFVWFCSKQNVIEPPAVTPAHIRLFLLSLQGHCKPVSVHDYYGVVNRFFNWLIQEGVIEQSPLSRMHPPRIPREIIQPFTADYIERMLMLCDGSFLGCRNRAIILTFLDTGLRLSEMANIKLSDIDFGREIIKVMGKGSRERLVRIGKETQRSLLKYLLQRSDSLPGLWVTEERRPMKAGGIQTVVRRLGQRIGIKGIRCSPHTFRHTFGTSALRHGADVRDVQSLLGHSTLGMTMRYLQTVSSEDAVRHHSNWSPVDNLKRKPK